ncbi:transposase [Escherichia coli]|nr:transposase [Escherichia coli]SQN18507.1 transposase [Escherichia coli]
MELQDWRKEPRKNYSNEFKLRMVELASSPVFIQGIHHAYWLCPRINK